MEGGGGVSPLQQSTKGDYRNCQRRGVGVMRIFQSLNVGIRKGLM